MSNVSNNDRDFNDRIASRRHPIRDNWIQISPGMRVVDRRDPSPFATGGIVVAVMDDFLVYDVYDAEEGQIVRKNLPHDFVAVLSCEADPYEYSCGITREELDVPDDFYVIDLQVRMMRESIYSRLGRFPNDDKRLRTVDRAFGTILRQVNAISMEQRDAMVRGEVRHA